MLDIDFDDKFIEQLANIICGDDYKDKFCEDDSLTKCPVYRTKQELEKFFKDITDFEFEYWESRTHFTIDCLLEVNKLKKMDDVLNKLTNPKNYLNEKIIKFIISEVNEILKWYDLQIKLENNNPIIVKTEKTFNMKMSEEANEFIILDFKQLIDDENLYKIMNKRWLEIKHTYEAKSYLSTIVLLGSILEGLLYFYASNNYKTVKSCSSAPKSKSGEVIPIDNWNLSELINVAHSCGWLDDDIKTFNEGLRDYRNLIHPKLQNEKSIMPDKDTCNICINVVIAAFNDLKGRYYLKN